MKKQLSNVSLIIGALLALSAFTVSAYDGGKLRARLVGSQEVPVVSTQASGDFEARVESDNTVTFKLSYKNIEGGAVAQAHIHLGQRSVNGGVMAFLCGGPKPACPASPATVEGTINAADILGLSTQQLPAGGLEEFVRALRNGTAYANVHTAMSPGGEIRGQIKGDDDDDHDR